jgi:hypothetical protein
MKKINVQKSLNTLQISDIYSLMFFLLYKIQDIPEYATVSEMCYLLDGGNLLRLLTYFAGKTIKIPTEEELSILINALLLYQYVNLDGETFVQAQNKLTNVTTKQKDKITELYLKIIPIINQYNIDRSQIQKYAR